MTAGYFAPLPPAKTGVADYAKTLFDALRTRGDVKIGAQDADIALYHVGNNQLHGAIYDRALAHPGGPAPRLPVRCRRQSRPGPWTEGATA